jgi:hypothetical protein
MLPHQLVSCFIASVTLLGSEEILQEIFVSELLSNLET